IQNVQPGHYTFAQGGIPGTYMKSVRWDGSDVTGKSLDIEGGGTLEVVYHAGAVRITGTAKDEKGESQGGAMVVLWPEQPLGGVAYPGARMAASDNQGTFALPALRPGNYYALAFEGTDGQTIQVRDLLMQFTAQAVKVEIKENSSPMTVATTVVPSEKI